MQKSTTENLTHHLELKAFEIKREARVSHSSGTRSISPPRKLPLALSLAPLEISVFQETLAAWLPRRPSERSTLASIRGITLWSKYGKFIGNTMKGVS